MKDYIEREAAIKAATAADLCVLDEYDMIKQIKDIPTADVRPVVHGKWNYGASDAAWCSICLYEADSAMARNSYNFCPNCGADMREVTDEKQDFNS